MALPLSGLITRVWLIITRFGLHQILYCSVDLKCFLLQPLCFIFSTYYLTKKSCSDGLNELKIWRVVVGGDFGNRFSRHRDCLLLLEYRDADGMENPIPTFRSDKKCFSSHPIPISDGRNGLKT